MFKAFWNEFKYVFTHKWKFIAWIVILLVPFFYGFFYANAYWEPFNKTRDLKVAVVNLDRDANGNETDTSLDFKMYLIDDFQKGKKIGNKSFGFNIVEPDHIYKTAEEAQKLVDEGTYSGLFIIQKDFKKNREVMRDELKATFKNIADNINKGAPDYHIDSIYVMKQINNVFENAKTKNKDYLVTFKNSYKNNYLAGEMTSMVSNAINLTLPIVAPTPTEVENVLISEGIPQSIAEAIANEYMNLFTLLTKHETEILKTYTVGENVNTYGFGLAPYFMSIALWAGSLVMLFLFQNKRRDKKTSTLKNYFGKSLAWLGTAWLQALILTTAFYIQGYRTYEGIWEIYLLNLFLATIFALTVQGIGYMLRRGDLGEVAAVILLVLQLVSSSGTFPVETENIIFRIVSPIIPFTYSVAASRQLLLDPDAFVILKNMAILLIFPVITTSIALGTNFYFDRKTRVKTPNGYEYKVFEIDMNDY